MNPGVAADPIAVSTLPAHHRRALALLARLSGRPRWALLTPERAWVAWGRRAVAVARGRARFARLEQAWQRWRSRWSGQAPGFPLLFAVAFHDQVAAPWKPWFPAGWLLFPRMAVVYPRQGAPQVFTLGDESPEGDLREPASPPFLEEPTGHDAAPPRPLSGLTRTAWEEMVHRALQAIARGELAKVVLARYQEYVREAPFDPWLTLVRLCRMYPSTTCFLMEPRPGLAFVGATPELLVRLSGKRVTTMALAGSAPRGATPQEDRHRARSLLHSAKNRREHAWVLQALVQALRPWTQDLRFPSRPRLRTLPNVHHLETPVQARLVRGTWWDLVRALHPTPALGGWPRQPALAFLRREEPFDRGWYGGVVGVVTLEGDGEAYVAIRSALVLGQRARLFAGAGIVSGSHPAQEWEETELKLQPMRQALGGPHGCP